MSACALAVSPAGAADHSVAACPPGNASFSVVPRARGAFALGPFSIIVNRAGLRVQSAGRVLWSSVSRVPFVGAGKGTVRFSDGGGFYQVQARFSRC
jgi:hypothetical protein